jgi:hypothetical protein
MKEFWYGWIMDMKQRKTEIDAGACLSQCKNPSLLRPV